MVEQADRLGDLNNDGILSEADIDILTLYILGYPISEISPLSEAEFLRRADVNGDGAINVLDISAIVRLILAWEFNPGEQKTAVVTMSNPKPKPFDYLAELYMGTDLALMASEDFHLEAEGSKDVSLPVTMPNTPGIYPVHIGVFSEGKSIGLYRATQDVVITVPDIRVEIAKAYIRMAYPSVSEAYSGWISFTPGSELNLALFGNPIQVGVMLRNPTGAPLKYIPTIYNYHWIPPNDYTTDYYTLPEVEPVRHPPAPTGMPYSNYEYECDKLLLPSGELAPGQTGFVYTELFYQSRRWNNVYIQIMSNDYDLGTVLIYSGWYSY